MLFCKQEKLVCLTKISLGNPEWETNECLKCHVYDFSAGSSES